VLCTACSRGPSPVGTWKSDAGRAWVQLAKDGTAPARLSFAIPNAEKPPQTIKAGFILDAGFWAHTYFSDTRYKCILQTKAARNPATLTFDQKEKTEDQIPWMKLPVHSDKSGNISVIQAVDGKPVTGYSVEKAGRILGSTELSGKAVRIEHMYFTASFVDPSVVWHGVLEINGRYTVQPNAVEIYVPLAAPQQSTQLIVGLGTLEGDTLRFDATGSELLTGSFARAPKEAALSIDMSGANVIDPKGIHGVEMGDGLYVNTGTTVDRMQNLKFRLPGRDVLGTFPVTEPTGGLLPPLTVARGAN
jgi:hypothetical protein